MCMNNFGTGAALTAREILPATVKPTHYNVNITPDLETFNFSGTVEVSLNVNETTKQIVCNANELEIKSAKVTTSHVKTETSQDATNIAYDKKAETVTFDFATEIPKGATAVLRIEYTGIHNDKMAGFYRSGYTDQQGKKKYMVTTQFEATDCRRAIPSWDEPNLKATFDITLNVPTDRTALSNMDVVQEKDVQIGGKTLRSVTFARTPIMSTYLVAFVVGELEYIEATANPKQPADAKPIKVRVYTQKGQKEQGKFALDVCARTLEFFSEYFDIAYPLPKMDLVAIPDFGAGAMENWGLVTYREIYLLYDQKTSSAKGKQRIAYVVGHELAHQWFGNLVTMDWWSELWLNEGFATFVGWLAVDNLFPEWKVWSLFLLDDYARGKELDALRSSHPIDVDVKNPAEITQIFDAISYCKGASVIRMLNSFLGKDGFKNGTRKYLKKHQYGNATTGALWAAYSDVSGQDVATFMHSWTRETGYPIVTVVKEEYDPAKKEMTLQLRQSRYLSSGDLSAEEEAKGTLWWVPLGIVTHKNPHAPTQQILSEKEATVSFPYTEEEGAFWKLNYSTTGFYRVRLAEAQLKRLGAVIKKSPNAISTEDRVGILADAFALAVAGYGSTAAALEMVRNFDAEEDYIVLDELASGLNSVIEAWYKEPEEVNAGLKALKRHIFSKKAKQLGFDFPEGEDHLTSLKRVLAIESAARADDKEVVAELQSRFEKFKAGDDKAIPSNIRGVTYSTVLKHTKKPKEDFDAVMNVYTSAPTVEQRLAALLSLGSINDKTLVDTVFALTLDAERVKPQDAYYTLSGLSAQNPDPKTIRPKIWDYVTKNWKALVERYTPSPALLGRMLTLGFVQQTGEEVCKQVEAWAEGADLSTPEEKEARKEEIKIIRRPLDQSLEKVREKTKWVQRDGKSVAKWVAEGGFA
ncbi:Aminopeptidase 2 mitochondrial [Borealophlyctis nickersoniae]|nr:Aminopeptidase 2 mitochondrial [Borealophlyctis nickersoniae]